MGQNRYQHCAFSVDEDVFIQFKEALGWDQLSMAKAIEQFLLSYVYCLDSSFAGSIGIKKDVKGRKPFQTRISENIYDEFVAKTDQEKSDMNVLFEQFFRNYTAFIKKVR
jgi:hypothetical protein